MDDHGQEEHSPVDEYLGVSTQVTDEEVRQYAEEGRLSELGFKLYKEAGSIVALCAHAYIGQASATMCLERNQAICAGLLTRITKFMIAVAQLSSGPDRGEVVMALNRCILESATNIRFLALKNEDIFYDQFVRFGLAPERELYDLIIKNIAAREGTQLNIETRMLASIHRVCELSGVEIERVKPRHGDWGGGLRNRLEALGQPDAYVLQQRIGSHAVHGTWVDLLLHHLDPSDGGFVPNPNWTSTEARLFGPVAVVVLEAARDYLRTFLGDHADLEGLYKRIDRVREDILRVERAHDDWLESRQPGGAPPQEA